MTRRGVPYVNVDQLLAEEALPVICKGHPYAVGWWMESTQHGGLQIGHPQDPSVMDVSVHPAGSSRLAQEVSADHWSIGPPEAAAVRSRVTCER